MPVMTVLNAFPSKQDHFEGIIKILVIATISAPHFEPKLSTDIATMFPLIHQVKMISQMINSFNFYNLMKASDENEIVYWRLSFDLLPSCG